MLINICGGQGAIRQAEVQLRPGAITFTTGDIWLEKPGDMEHGGRLIMKCNGTALEAISSLYAMGVLETPSLSNNAFGELRFRLDKVLEAVRPTVFVKTEAGGHLAPPPLAPRADACPHCGFHAGHRANF